MSRRTRSTISVLILTALLAPAAWGAPERRDHEVSLISWVPRIVVQTVKKIVRGITSNDDLNVPPGNPKP